MTPNELYTVREVARYLRINYRKVLNAIHTEKIKVIRFGPRSWRITKEELDRIKQEGIDL